MSAGQGSVGVAQAISGQTTKPVVVVEEKGQEVQAEGDGVVVGVGSGFFVWVFLRL